MAFTRHIAISLLDTCLREKIPPELVPLARLTHDAVSEADERFIRAMVLTTLRHLGQLDELISMALEKPLPSGKHWVKCAIRIGLAQASLMRVPAHATIHATVEAVKRSKYKGLAGLANAVLRKHTDHAPALPHAMHNVPPWLRERWNAHYGDITTQIIARVCSNIPPTDVHCLEPQEFSGGIVLNSRITRLPQEAEIVEREGFAAGNFFVQDIAASFPVAMLGSVAGKTVLEIGAAPGGKTAQLCAGHANVTALDRSASRTAMLRENMARLHFNPEIVVRDVFDYQPTQVFDVIVLDAPCSATGTWRRHPEVLHIVEPQQVAELCTNQANMLERCWGWLKPGGTLLYAVCSLEQEEGEGHIDWFLSRHSDAKLRPLTEHALIHPDAIHPRGYLRTLPSMLAEQGGMDGFFAVMFEKIA